MRILTLIVDDEELVRKAIVSAVRGEQITCTPVDSLAQAVATLRIKSFDVILLDLKLADSEGVDTFDRVRYVAPHTPIVVMTGYIGPEEKTLLMGKGASQILTKPLRAQDVIDAIHAASDVDVRGNTPLNMHVEDASPWLPVVEHFQRVVTDALNAHERRQTEALCKFAENHEEKLDLRFQLLKKELKQRDTDPPQHRTRKLSEYTKREWFSLGRESLKILGVIATAYAASRWGTSQAVTDAVREVPAIIAPAK